MDFHEYRIDAGAHPCRCQRLDVLGETGCDAIVGNDAAWRGRTEIPFVFLKDAVTNQ